VIKNLEGARVRLENGRAAGPSYAIDVAAVLAQVEASLAAVRLGEAPPPVAIRRLEAGAP
jgi:hypothetical protein